MRRLSGWARLWIVILVPVWSGFTAFNLYREQERWRSACNWAGCAHYSEPIHYDDNGQRVIFPSEFVEFADDPPESAVEWVEAEKARRESASTLHHHQVITSIAYPLVGALLAFVLAMIAKSAVIWVWRGFRPKTN